MAYRTEQGWGYRDVTATAKSMALKGESASLWIAAFYTGVHTSDNQSLSFIERVIPVAKFWIISHPNYDSDYRFTYINGSLERPFGLPGVKCDICGSTWGGGRVLAHECPPKFQQDKNLREGWPISRTEHAKLQRELMAAIGIDGEPFIDLRPGDDFQPGYLDVPSRPTADFLWPGLRSFVVSDRVRDLLLREAGNDVAVRPVIMRKIGKRDANLPPPMPSTGEPEDMINEAALLDQASAAGSYSEFLVLHESGFPPGGTPISVCSGCRRPEIGPNRQLKMTPEMWKGEAIFFMATTLHVIVTDKLKKSIESIRPTNVIFEAV